MRYQRKLSYYTEDWEEMVYFFWALGLTLVTTIAMIVINSDINDKKETFTVISVITGIFGTLAALASYFYFVNLIHSLYEYINDYPVVQKREFDVKNILDSTIKSVDFYLAVLAFGFLFGIPKRAFIIDASQTGKDSELVSRYLSTYIEIPFLVLAVLTLGIITFQFINSKQDIILRKNEKITIHPFLQSIGVGFKRYETHAVTSIVITSVLIIIAIFSPQKSLSDGLLLSIMISLIMYPFFLANEIRKDYAKRTRKDEKEIYHTAQTEEPVHWKMVQTGINNLNIKSIIERINEGIQKLNNMNYAVDIEDSHVLSRITESEVSVLLNSYEKMDTDDKKEFQSDLEDRLKRVQNKIQEISKKYYVNEFQTQSKLIEERYQK